MNFRETIAFYRFWVFWQSSSSCVGFTKFFFSNWVVLKLGIGFLPREKINTKFQYHPVTKEKFREINAFWQNSVNVAKFRQFHGKTVEFRHFDGKIWFLLCLCCFHEKTAIWYQKYHISSIRRFMKARLWVHFGRALRLASTKILHPRRFQTTPGRFSKQSWGVRPWWRESPYTTNS